MIQYSKVIPNQSGRKVSHVPIKPYIRRSNEWMREINVTIKILLLT